TEMKSNQASVSFACSRKLSEFPPVKDPAAVLETLLQRHIPDSPPDIGRPLVVAAFERASDKRRILVEHVVHAKGDRGVIEPCAPPTWIVLRGRDRHNVLLLTIFHLSVLAAVPGVSSDLVLH